MICYGISNSISAITTGYIVKMTGRVPVVCCAFLLNLGIVIFLLTWGPTPEDKILFFVVTGLWGICDGVWLVQINGKVTCIDIHHYSPIKVGLKMEQIEGKLEVVLFVSFWV
jgi:predicted MFS family arabinose efflux permease